jgi:hypothetical protein
MPARCLYYKKQEHHGGIVEMVIWQLPARDAERPHGLKYRLAYVKEGRRIVGYDNERGKGDHRHLGNKEHRYVFRGIEQLIKDFWKDVKRHGDG